MIIGYVSLVPSILGIIFTLFALFATGAGNAKANAFFQQEIREKLHAEKVPKAVINSVIARENPDGNLLDTLTSRQQSQVEEKRVLMNAADLTRGTGAVLAGGLAIALLIASLFGALIGWLLTLKKGVLQCTSCSAVPAAP